MGNSKVYQYWNGKNIEGKSYVGDPDLIKAIDRGDSQSLMKYEVGCDTFSADDLQSGVQYE